MAFFRAMKREWRTDWLKGKFTPAGRCLLRPRARRKFLRKLRARTPHSAGADGRGMPGGIERGCRQCGRDGCDGGFVDAARRDCGVVRGVPASRAVEASNSICGFLIRHPSAMRPPKPMSGVFWRIGGPRFRCKQATRGDRISRPNARPCLPPSHVPSPQSWAFSHLNLPPPSRHRESLGSPPRRHSPRRCARRTRGRTRSSPKASRLAGIVELSTPQQLSAKPLAFSPCCPALPTNCRFQSSRLGVSATDAELRPH